MAKTQEKQAFITETSPIIMEHVHDQEGIDTDDYEQDRYGCGSGCFRFFSFGNQSSVEGDRTKFLQQTGDHDPHKETWFNTKVKELKEYSELVAGPKWKNFIRKFSKKPKTKSTHQFQYDPQSYALNFNNGGCDDEDDGFLARNFSTRFAPPSSSNRDQQRRPAT